MSRLDPEFAKPVEDLSDLSLVTEQHWEAWEVPAQRQTRIGAARNADPSIWLHAHICPQHLLWALSQNPWTIPRSSCPF